jgi:DNA-binding transcriptional ArsR family regulator
MRKSPILDALLTPTKAKILTSLVLRPEKDWYLSELASEHNTSPSSLQRDLRSLTSAGVLRTRRDGKRVYFSADTASPVYSDLRGIFEKTSGLVPMLQFELASLAKRIAVAWVYGSVASSREESHSDIDVMVVGDIGLSQLAPALRRCESKLGRPVNATVYSRQEFAAKVKSGDHFLSAVLKTSKQYLVGGEDELDSLSR